MGMYCYDHLKYNMMKDWLKSHHLSFQQTDPSGSLLEESNGVSETYLMNRNRSRLREIQEMGANIPEWRPSSVLDFGGDKGTLASLLADGYGLSSDKVIVTDIASWYGHVREKRYSNVEYVTLNSSRLPFASESFNTILCMMVLHHIQEIEPTLRELRRIMKTGGILFLREHDAGTEEQKRAVDIEHSIHELVESSKTVSEALRYLAEYRGFYRSIEEWNELLSDVGFREVSMEYKEPRGASRYVSRCYIAE